MRRLSFRSCAALRKEALFLQMPASDFCLPEEDTLLQACRAALRRRTEFEALHASVAFSELVSNKMLVMYYQRYSFQRYPGH